LSSEILFASPIPFEILTDASDIQATSEWLTEATKGDLQFLIFPIRLEFDDGNVLKQIELTLENLNDGRKHPISARVVEELG
jgi:hypothetical protein